MLFFFNQKTWYQNNTNNNRHTVFWDAGFIILKDDKVLLHSVQVGGRMETYSLSDLAENNFTFNSFSILHDPKTITSQRIFIIDGNNLHYKLNMATHAASFQNHLIADLKRLLIK